MFRTRKAFHRCEFERDEAARPDEQTASGKRRIDVLLLDYFDF